MKRLLSLLLLLLPIAAIAQSTTTIRVCTYNVLNFGADESSDRIRGLQIAMDITQPDILVVQDLDGQEGMTAFFNAMITDGFTVRVGFDGPDADNGLLLKNKVEYLSHVAHATALRNIDEFLLRVVGTTDTLHIFTCYLKRGDSGADSLDRIEEATILRRVLDTIPQHHHRIVAGDLNVHASIEEAYQVLTRVGIVAGGEVADPIDRPGYWNNNPDFAGIHTQSTRVRSIGGGATGGMNDRFDFVLVSPSLMSHVVAGSYTTFGNDGAHFNDSINSPTNTAVHPITAQALHDASDHLPVYLDLQFTVQTSAVPEDRKQPAEMDLTEGAMREERAR